MAREVAYHRSPETVFQACINAIAYLEWAIQERDESLLRIKIRTPFTVKKTRPSFQDEIDVEIIVKEDRSIVWVDSNPRFQIWNWWKDKRNEKAFIEEVSREIERITTQQPPGQAQTQPQNQSQPRQQPQQGQPQQYPKQGIRQDQSQSGQSTTGTAHGFTE